MKKIIIEIPGDLKKEFILNCVEIDMSQKYVLIELICLWNNGKVKIPGQPK